jgi:molecular chaperone DnaJ
VPPPPSDLPPGFDAYQSLQVVPEADPEVIQAAYRRLAHKFHPDRAAGAEAARRMVEINAAWEILGDPARRAAYDRKRAAAAVAAAGATAAATPHGPPPSATSSQTASPGQRGDGHGSSGRRAGPTERPAERVSGDWSSGRSSVGSGYDPSQMRAPDGTGAAGPPPGHPSGSVLNFGRYAGWSLGEIGRTDPEYLEWLDRAPIGRQHRPELDVILRRLGRRRTQRPGDASTTRGLFRRG